MRAMLQLIVGKLKLGLNGIFLGLNGIDFWDL
jgi:hypothetical protein